MDNLNINYIITKPQIEAAYIRFQRQYMLKKSYIFASLFLVATVVNVMSVVKNPDFTSGYLLSAIGLGFMAISLLRTKIQRKQFLNSIEGIDDESYITHVSDTEITIQTENADDLYEYDRKTDEERAVNIEPTVLTLGEDIEVLDAEDMLVVYEVKRNFYIIPKSAIGESLNKMYEIFNKNEVKVISVK